MSILTRHIFYIVFTQILLACLFVSSIIATYDIMSYSIQDQGDFGWNSVFQAILNALYKAPFRMYAALPITFVGGYALAIAYLIKSKELIILRVSGFSLLRIFFLTAVPAVFFMSIAFYVGEFIAPSLHKMAKDEIRVAKGKELNHTKGYWDYLNGTFTFIQEISYEGKMYGVRQFQVNDKHEVEKIFIADEAEHEGKSLWVLKGVNGVELKSDQIQHFSEKTIYWNNDLSAKQMKDRILVGTLLANNASSIRIKRFIKNLSIEEVYESMQKLNNNSGGGAIFEFSFIQRLMFPFQLLFTIALAYYCTTQLAARNIAIELSVLIAGVLGVLISLFLYTMTSVLSILGVSNLYAVTLPLIILIAWMLVAVLIDIRRQASQE